MKHIKTLGNIPFLLSVLTMAATFSLPLSATAKGNADNGKTLFAKSQCQKCHGTEVFTREDRKVTDTAGLEKQVRMCDSQLSVNWFDDEIDDVVAYLNKTYYKFPDADTEGDAKE